MGSPEKNCGRDGDKLGRGQNAVELTPFSASISDPGELGTEPNRQQEEEQLQAADSYQAAKYTQCAASEQSARQSVSTRNPLGDTPVRW